MDALNASSREAEDEPFARENAFQANVFQGPDLQIAPRSELAVRRFTEFCRNKNWGSLLYHKVGTGKTIASLLIALNFISGSNKKIVVVAPPGLFSNFRKDLRHEIGLGDKVGRLVDYPYPELINDINQKNYEKLKVFEGNIAIFDEAHRLLSDVINTSSESGNDSNRHCLFVDTPFQHAAYKAERCILLTGTPVQKDFADICRIMNFLKRTNTYDTHTYAQKTQEQFRKKKLLELSKIALNAVRKKGIATFIIDKIVPGFSTLNSDGGLVDIIINFLIAAGVPLSVAGAVKVADDILVDSLLANVQDATETLDENVYDITRLAEDSKEYISLYDYDIQKEYINLKEFLDSLKRANPTPLMKYGVRTPFERAYPEKGGANIPANVLATLPTESPPPNLSFPEKLVTLSTKLYSKFQYDLLSRMYMGLLEDIEKDIFYIDQFLGSNSASNSAIRLNRTRANVIGRVIGNLSEDIYHFTTTLQDEKRTYKAVNRVDGAIYTDTKPVFACDKFEEILACIKRSATGETVVSTYSDEVEEIPVEDEGIPYAATKIRTDTTFPHPHRGPGNSVYLPIVYSFTEELGTSLFGAYLESLGYSYILIHQEQTKGVLEQQIQRATRRTYPVLERGEELPKRADRPICAILHPKMTEGINCTYNPEIILMDVCNTYGDMEQVHGRVLRRYGPSDVEEIKAAARRRGEEPTPVTKVIRQMISDSKSDDAAVRSGRRILAANAARGAVSGLRRIGEIFGYAKQKLLGIPGQKFFYEFSDFKSWILKFKCESPDLNGLRRLLKEETNLEQFTKFLIENDAETVVKGCRPREVCSASSIKGGRCARALEKLDLGRRTYKIRYRGLTEELRPRTKTAIFTKGDDYLVQQDPLLQEMISHLPTREARVGCRPLGGCLRRRRGGNTVSKRPNARNGNAAKTNTRRKKND